MNRRLRKLLTTLTGSAAAAAMMTGAAATAPAEGDGHKVLICHVTSSEGNPYTVIEVDVAAFDGDGANDHSQHKAPDGRTDVLYDEDNGCGGDTTF